MGKKWQSRQRVNVILPLIYFSHYETDPSVFVTKERYFCRVWCYERLKRSEEILKQKLEELDFSVNMMHSGDF